MLVMVCGLPGTGKTTVAKELAKRIGAEVLSTDVIRKGILPEPTYSEDEREMVYTVMLQRAESLVRDGGNVILDGTFSRRKYRQAVYSLASREGIELKIIETTAPEESVRKWMFSRKDSYSDADFEVHHRIRGSFENIEKEHLTVDTSREGYMEIVLRGFL